MYLKQINEVQLQRKSSFHVSLICVKNLIKKCDDSIEEKVIDMFCEFVKSNPISFEGFTGEYRFVERKSDDRKTLVGMVHVSNLDNFFELIRKELQIDIDAQPTHVTLYTLKLDEGIGINDQKNLEEMTTLVSVPEIEEILK